MILGQKLFTGIAAGLHQRSVDFKEGAALVVIESDADGRELEQPPQAGLAGEQRHGGIMLLGDVCVRPEHLQGLAVFSPAAHHHRAWGCS